MDNVSSWLDVKIFPMLTGLGRVYGSDSVKAKMLKRITKALYKLSFKGCNCAIFQNPDDITEFVDGKYLPANKCKSVNGFLVPVKSPEMLAERMLTLCRDREKLLSMGEMAYRCCAERYDVAIVNKQMRDIMGY